MRPIARGVTIAGVPALVAAPVNATAPLRTVLWFHGFRADALAHAEELERCAAMGFLAVGIDAAGHGARRDEQIAARIEAAGGALPVMFDLADRTIDQLPAVVNELVNVQGAHRSHVSAVGISMGAFLAYRSVARGLPFRAVVALLGSPEWSGPDSPHRTPHAFADVALLSITAEHDENVSPVAVRQLHEALRGPSRGVGHHRHFELLGSGHLTSAAHWERAMRETMSWLQRFG